MNESRIGRFSVFGSLCVRLCLVLMCLLGIRPVCGEQTAKSEAIRAKFQQYLSEWERISKSFPTMLHSDPLKYTQNEPFGNIVNLGLPVVPCLINVMKEDPNGMAALCMHEAFTRITKRRFFGDNTRNAGSSSVFAPIILWWEKGRGQSAEHALFDSAYKELKNAPSIEEKLKIYQHLLELGIPALPFAVEAIGSGEKELWLWDAVNYWTDGSLGVDASKQMVRVDTRAAFCVYWWERNKDKWLLPSVEPKADQ